MLDPVTTGVVVVLGTRALTMRIILATLALLVAAVALYVLF